MRALQPSLKSGARARGLPARRWLALVVGGSLLSQVSRVAAGEVAVGGADDPGAVEPTGAAAASAHPVVSDSLRGAQRMLLERAKQRYEAGRGAPDDARPHLEGALDALDLAYRLAPAPWLLFNMAQVQSRLGACSEAAQLYHRFLESDPTPEARRSTEQALELLGSCEDSDAQRVTAEVLPGLRLQSSFDSIFAARGVAAPSSPTVSAEPVEEGSAGAVLPWSFGSLSVISAVAGAIYWSEARAAKRDFDRIRIAGPAVAQTQERGESAQNLARAFGGLAIGFALATGASYWWLRPERGEAPVAGALEHISWLPLAGGAGAAYHSEF
jgi:tetratricopeptide (TPR) repeat protein